jgi:hypothetical protein
MNHLHNLKVNKFKKHSLSSSMTSSTAPTPPPKDPGHPYASTNHISFTFHSQRTSNAPFGYDHYISLPPAYHSSPNK